MDWKKGVKKVSKKESGEIITEGKREQERKSERKEKGERIKKRREI